MPACAPFEQSPAVLSIMRILAPIALGSSKTVTPANAFNANVWCVPSATRRLRALSACRTARGPALNSWTSLSVVWDNRVFSSIAEE